MLEYIAGQSEAKLVELTSDLDKDFYELKAALREANLAEDTVSSFFTSADKLVQLRFKLNQSLPVHQVSIQELRTLLKESKSDLIVTVDPLSTVRIMQEEVPIVGNNTANSTIFNDISPYSLSGLWVALFLIVVLLIAVNCLMDLKTNDRFARQNLWVGRES